jgi:hypothetical protein
MKSTELKLDKLQENLQKSFPDFGVLIQNPEAVGEKIVIEVVVNVPDQVEITFHQIKNFFDDKETEDQDSVSLLEEALVTIVESHLSIYAKADKKQILKDCTSIVKLVDAEPTSFHKLKEDELTDKMKIYELEEKDFIKEEK